MKSKNNNTMNDTMKTRSAYLQPTVNLVVFAARTLIASSWGNGEIQGANTNGGFTDLYDEEL